MNKGQIYQICPAMERAGIKDPDSQVGMDFCVQQCPYPKCMVFEGVESTNRVKKMERVARAKELADKGYKIYEIAKELGVRPSSVKRYLYR